MRLPFWLCYGLLSSPFTLFADPLGHVTPGGLATCSTEPPSARSQAGASLLQTNFHRESSSKILALSDVEAPKKSQSQVTAKHTRDPQELFVAADGGVEGGDGTREEPLESVQNCIDRLKAAPAGSACKLLGGRYRLRQPVEITAFDSGETKVITAADPEDPPIIDGTVEIPHSSWLWAPPSQTGCRSGCWYAGVAAVDWEPWQLFVGEDMLLNARWPNAQWPNALWESKSLFQATKSWGVSHAKSTFSGPSRCVRDPPDNGTSCVFEGQRWTFNRATGKCENEGKMECRRAEDGGMAPIAEPAECTMHDDTPAHPETGSKPLGAEGFDVSGASVVLNLGHSVSYAGVVKKHKGSTFTYDSRASWNVNKFVSNDSIYFLENHIQLLDAPGEWFYDQDAKEIYLKTPDDAHPSKAFRNPVSARVLDYAFKIIDSTDVTLSNMTFFASTIFAAGDKDRMVTNIVWDNLIFNYPSATMRMLGDVDSLSPTTIVNHPSHRNVPVANQIKNCQFRYTEGSPTIELSNPGFKISNNLFEYIDWSAVSTITAAKKMYRPSCGILPLPPTATGCFSRGASTLELPAGIKEAPLIFERNTVRYHGAANGVGIYGAGKRSVVVFNHIHGKSDLQLDGALITISASAAFGVEMRRNWLHDALPARPRAAKLGARFDRGQSECSRDWGENGIMTENVVYRTSGINVKGNGHHIVQNAVFWSGRDAADDTAYPSPDISLYGSEGGFGTCECRDRDCKARPSSCCVENDEWTFENKKSVIVGNAMEHTTQDVNQVYKNQGVQDVRYNSAGTIETDLQDPLNLDFRPLPSSVLARQCIGAYGGGAMDEYWIPGFQELWPSMPVPPDGSSTTKVTASIAFNPARGAQFHYLYASKSRAHLEWEFPSRSKLKSIMKAPNNVFTFIAGSSFMKPGRTVYWRVDPDFGTGPVRSPIWSFTVQTSSTIVDTSSCQNFTHPGGTLKDSKLDGTAKTFLPTVVPVNGGMSHQYFLASAAVCIHAEYATKSKMRSLAFKLRHKTSTGGVTEVTLGKPSGDIGKDTSSVSGCFEDTASSAYLVGPAPWKPASGSIVSLVEGSRLWLSSRTFDLFVYDQQADGQAGKVLSWSLDLCYKAAEQQPGNESDAGVCAEFPYN